MTWIPLGIILGSYREYFITSIQQYERSIDSLWMDSETRRIIRITDVW